MRAPVTRQVRHENAQILVGKAAREIGHDLFVCGQPMKQHNEAPRVIVALIDYVGDQPAAPGADDRGGLAVRRSARQHKAAHAQHNAKRGAQPLSPLHGRAPCAASRNSRA